MSDLLVPGRAAPRSTRAAEPGSRPALVVGIWAAFGLVASYWCLALTGVASFTPALVGTATLVAVAAPTAACWSAVAGRSRGRADGRLATVAVTAFAVGTTWNVAAVVLTGGLPVPSPADLGFLGFYPMVLGALAVNLRHRLAELRSSAWIDLTSSLLAVLAVLSVPLGPVLGRAVQGQAPPGTAFAVLYPVGDLMLATVLIAAVVTLGTRAVVGWGWMVAGLLTFAATDVVFALGTMSLPSLSDSPIQLGWFLGLALSAMWVLRLTADRGGGRGDDRVLARTERAETVVASTAASATVTGLAVLVLGTRVHLSVPTLVLAGLTIAAFGARAQIAFRAVRRSAGQLRLAHVDHLTDLPNRRALYAAAAERLGPHAPGCVLLLMDLDRFKEVNDSLGHHMGDRLLVEVGTRLQSCLPAGALLARLGGDEFAILVPEDGTQAALDLAAALRAVLDDPFELDGMAVEVTMSIGVAVFPDHGEDLPSLLRRADIAMYKAKGTTSRVHVYAPEADIAATERLARVQELRQALANGEFVVHYQPKLTLGTGAITGVEALVRWQHPVDGLRPPSAFLELTEDAGLMHQLTRTVLTQALDQVVRWHREGVELTVAVNLSASSLIDTQVPERVLSMLAARGLRPDRLQLEITEDVLMADREQARAILVQLRASGVRIAIDDFGSGYSSLAYLRDLPIDELKIDRSFIEPMTRDARAAALVAATVALGHSLDLVVVAEGVEDEATQARLAAMACDQVQGFHIARPMPGDEVRVWLRR